jgi:hypothetical protein
MAGANLALPARAARKFDMVSRVVAGVASFIRAAFWPLSAAIVLVALLQPLYLAALGTIDAIAPRAAIERHVRDAFEQGVLGADGRPASLIFRGGEQLTECISLGVGLDPGETSWQAAVTGSYPGGDYSCLGLYRAVTGGPVTWEAYSRYWHGYRVILAPLAAAMPYWLVKGLLALALGGASVLLWRALRDRGDWTVATVFLLPIVCLTDILYVWRTATHTISLIFIFAGTWLWSRLLQRNWGLFPLVVVAAAFGSFFNYIDFLVNPPMMPMLLMFFALLYAREDTRWLPVLAVLAWFVGYGETWAAKWIIAVAFSAHPAAVAADIFAMARFRISGALPGVVIFPLYATAKAYLRALEFPGAVVPAAILIAIVHDGATTSRIDIRGAAWLCSPVLVSVLWFEVLSSHTQWHITPSSRSAAVGIGLILSALLLSMAKRPTMAELGAHLKSAIMLRWSKPELGAG